MSLQEINDFLLKLLGPLKQHKQAEGMLEKLTDLLKTALTQDKLYTEWQFSLLPEPAAPGPEITKELNDLANDIFATIPQRPADEKSYWIRERDFPFSNGPEGNLGNALEPEYSIGPFIINDYTELYYDLFLITRQFVFYSPGRINPLMVISLHQDMALPNPVEPLLLESCSLWIDSQVLTDTTAPDKSYVCIHAKNCTITFPAGVGIAGPENISIPSILPLTFEFAPESPVTGDAAAGNDASDITCTLPDKVSITILNNNAIINHAGSSSMTVFGTTSAFDEAASVKAVYNKDLNQVRIPLQNAEESWTAGSSKSNIMKVAGTGPIQNSGWYNYPLRPVDTLGLSQLGKCNSSGQLGLEIGAGIKLEWEGLENGPLIAQSFFLRGGNGSLGIIYTFKESAVLEQHYRLWLNKTDSTYYSDIRCRPLTLLPGFFAADAVGYEYHRQFAEVKTKIDRPVTGNGKRFDFQFPGITELTKTDSGCWLTAIASNNTPVNQNEPLDDKLNKTSSIVLENALLTVQTPLILTIKAKGEQSDLMTHGIFMEYLPVFRIIHTLPDPYISNQKSKEDIFDEANQFNTFPPRSALLAVTIKWNSDDVKMDMQLAEEFRTVFKQKALPDDDLRNYFPNNFMNPCQTAYNDALTSPLQNHPVIRQFMNPENSDYDAGNLIGAFGFLQWMPGDICLVDVSGRASQMGVAFSSPWINNALGGGNFPLNTTGYGGRFTYQINNMELVSSGRLVRAFTLPHIQWEPVTNIENPNLTEAEVPFPLYFNSNGAPTRIASSNKENISLSPKKVLQFICESYNSQDKHAASAYFNLPFGMCAVAYFNPEKSAATALPVASLNFNQPDFNTKKLGQLNGAIQLNAAAYYKDRGDGNSKITPDAYFHGSTLQVAITDRENKEVKIDAGLFDIEYSFVQENSILGIPITRQFNAEFFGAYPNNETIIREYSVNAKVPLKRIDFSGYGASIFSNWLNDKANFGRVSQTQFTVMMGRTAHEVIQIKSFIIGFCIPVVRSIIMQRQNHGLVTRYDTGWQPTGPGIFNYILTPGEGPQENPYAFHPGTVRGIYNVRSIRDTTITLKQGSNEFAGVYFDGDILMENIEKGFIANKPNSNESFVPSKGQFGYVLLCDPSKVTDKNTLDQIFPDKDFQDFLNRPDVGSLGGPVDCMMNIAGSNQRMHVTRVDISATADMSPLYPVAAQGTLELPKEGSWSVVKCLSSKNVVQLGAGETVSLIRHGKLSFINNNSTLMPVVDYQNSRYIIGNPEEIGKYIVDEPANLNLQYGLLQTTPTQKILFNRPMFVPGNGPVVNGVAGGVNQLFTDVPRLGDVFKLLSTNSIFPELGNAFSLPSVVKSLDIGADLNGYNFPEAIAEQLTNFESPNFASLKVLKIINEEAFKIHIDYDNDPANPGKSPFSLDLSSGIPGRKSWEMINAKVSIVVEVGPLVPLLTVQGNFHAEYGKTPIIEDVKLLWGPDGALRSMVEILEVLAKLDNLGKEKPNAFEKGIELIPANSTDSWNYKCSIEKSIPVIQFPSTQDITLTGPPPVIIEAALDVGVFFNLSLSPDPKELAKSGAGVTFGFQGMIQIMLVTLEFATAYGVGTAKIRIYIDVQNPTPQFDYTCGFGASVAVQLPVVGVVSVTRSVSLTGNISEKKLLLMASTLLRGVLSLAGGLLSTSIQIEGGAGVIREGGDEIKARIELTFSLNVSLAFVISYDFTEKFMDEIPFNKII
ncbi:hypothetical protein SNE25_21500 [Mucilaginibacter sabulilitoris]|uniref:Uncharacterized protein n=1 Tax=Mucilaginibacter sabulilitoris TaxID=1173583 RepID=A0ABZ0TH26_9SPHI|nr:hypothetical protein [Mucilaginibacter sabulilitoris]WPU91896.1 hypothetical protein SNE25_21500 [Mucilaginibacter sabulilitoris]